MDPLHFCIAVGPLAMYLLVLGLINLSSRPLLTTGTRDMVALGIAISGLVVVGPMELFLPEAAAARFGSWVWALLLAFYTLTLILIVLLMKPRLIIYNITLDQLRPVLANLAQELDEQARWAGESLALPNLGVQLFVHACPPLRIVQLVAAGPDQNFAGWRRLEFALAASLADVRSRSNRWGVLLIAAGLLFAGAAAAWVIADQQGVLQALNGMLRR